MSAYLDYAASAPLRLEVLESYTRDLAYFAEQGANPNALHAQGRAVREMLESARAEVAELLGADSAEVIFTSGATESNSLALSAAISTASPSSGYVTSRLEHPASSAHATRAASVGLEVRWAEVSPLGVVETDSVSELASSGDVAVASFMAVDNEVGAIQPVKELTRAVRDRSPGALIHCDAAQAVGHVPVSFHDFGVDSLALSGHKFGAPIGVGALLVKRGFPQLTDRPGGGQERGMRSGTQNVAGARALACALRIASRDMGSETQRLGQLRDRLVAGLDSRVRLSTTAPTSPHIIHLSTGRTPPEVLLMAMDNAGVAVSAASACAAGVARPSSSLLAMGYPEDQAMGALRVSIGHATTEADVDAFVGALPDALDTAERFNGRSR